MIVLSHLSLFWIVVLWIIKMWGYNVCIVLNVINKLFLWPMFPFRNRREIRLKLFRLMWNFFIYFNIIIIELDLLMTSWFISLVHKIRLFLSWLWIIRIFLLIIGDLYEVIIIFWFLLLIRKYNFRHNFRILFWLV